jgi:hypothetical protein
LLEPAVTAYRACGSACAIGSNWVCLGKVNWPFPVAAKSTVHLSLYDFATGAPEVGVQASLCSTGGGCGSVVGVSDDAGEVAVEVPLPAMSTHNYLGPVGAIRFSAADDAGASGIATMLLYWGFPLSQPSLGALGLGMVTPAERSALDAGPQLAGRGYLAITVADCSGIPAAGVTFTLSPSDGARLFYVQNQVFVDTATQTDSFGLAAAYNVVAGPVQVTATLAATGEIVGRESVVVQPDVSTVLNVRPTPLTP